MLFSVDLDSDPELRKAVFVHEVGHAMGIRSHSSNFVSIMHRIGPYLRHSCVTQSDLDFAVQYQEKGLYDGL